MRFKVIMILGLLLAVAMGMQDAKANIPEQVLEECSANEAFKRGQAGQEKPQNCAIGKASVVHDSWTRGYHEHVSSSGNVKISSKSETQENN